MNKLLLCFSIALIISGCRNNSAIDTPHSDIEVDKIEKKILNDQPDSIELLIETIDNNLMNKVDISIFLDSLTNQNNIILQETLTESFDEEKKHVVYKSKDREYYLKVLYTDSTSNTLFYDGNNVIDFSKHRILSSNNSDYKTEDFGFNFRNRLGNPRIIQIAKKLFLYADIIFDCNGKGCGCQLNFIYDINAKRAFFIDNFRFPYDKYFISDFNNDNIIDLLIIGRNKDGNVKGLPIQRLSYQATWFEYRNSEFKIKRGMSLSKPYSFEFISYSRDGDYAETNYSLIINN